MARVLFLGTPDFAVPSLRALAAAGHVIVAAVSQPDRPKGRGRRTSPTPVAACARELGIPLLQPESCRDAGFVAEAASLAPDYLAVVAYGQILPAALLALPAKMPINLHASLLPRWRGASPIAWAIVSGDEVTGVTTMVVRQALDSGEILMQEEEGIRPDDTAASLAGRLAIRGAELLKDTVDAVEAGRVFPRVQDETLVTWARLLRKEDGRIDWSKPAEAVDRRVRGLFPWPRAFATRSGRRLAILGGRPLPAAKGVPGEVLAADTKEGITVSCGTGAYLIERLGPENHAVMDAGDFVSGYRVVPGELWGEG